MKLERLTLLLVATLYIITIVHMYRRYGIGSTNSEQSRSKVRTAKGMHRSLLSQEYKWDDKEYQMRCANPENHDSIQCSKFTIVMQTYDRDVLLMKLISHYLQSPLVDRIAIIWNDIKRQPTFNATMFTLRADQQLKVFVQQKNSMNNRFNLPEDFVRTDAVIIIDDDIKVALDQLASAFKIWRSNPRKLVSFHQKEINSQSSWPFACDYNEHVAEDKKYEWFYTYTSDCNYRNGTAGKAKAGTSVHVVLVGTTFIHRAFFNMYHNHIPAALREMVDEVFNCDDLVMTFSHAYHTQESPIFALIYSDQPPLEILQNEKGHFAGISAAADSHLRKRTECIKRLVKVYGKMPLQEPIGRAVP
jgi:hypothetical protein